MPVTQVIYCPLFVCCMNFTGLFLHTARVEHYVPVCKHILTLRENGNIITISNLKGREWKISILFSVLNHHFCLFGTVFDKVLVHMSVNTIHWDVWEVIICVPYTTARYLMTMVPKDFKQHTGLACSTF